MLEEYRVDLHVHTCLSPCADDSMVPPVIVGQAIEGGLDWIGIADHNTDGNVAAVVDAAAGTGLAVSAGMEVTTAEEVHLLALFDDRRAASELSRIVGARLPGRNDERAFGRQLVADAAGNVRGESEALLIGATTLTAAEVVDAVHRLGGLVVASHVDRPSYSVVSQLGVVPPSLALDAVELSARAGGVEAARDWQGRLGLPVLRFSDAHAPEEIGRIATVARLAAPTVAELGRALRGDGGREVVHR